MHSHSIITLQTDQNQGVLLCIGYQLLINHQTDFLIFEKKRYYDITVVGHRWVD